MAALAAVALSPLVAACTGDDDGATTTTVSTAIPAADYADAVCGALQPLPDLVVTVVERQLPEGQDDPEAAREAVLADLTALQEAVGAAEADVEATPPPDVPGGADTDDRITRALRRAALQTGRVIAFIRDAEEPTEEVLFERNAVIVVISDFLAVFQGDPIPIPAELNEALLESTTCQDFAEATAQFLGPEVGAPPQDSGQAPATEPDTGDGSPPD